MCWFRDSQEATDDIKARDLKARENLDALDALEKMPEQLEPSEQKIMNGKELRKLKNF